METGTFHVSRTEPSAEEGRVLCSVCVCTYRRPDLLAKLLESLENQTLPERVDLEVIVVDNDPMRSGEPIVRRFTDSPRIRFSYFTQPVRSISITRNMTVEKSSGTYLLFIDDDETASPEWISRLLGMLERFSADGVFGPVMPEFHPQTPFWMRRRELFYGPMQTTGERADALWTSNCLVRAEILKKMTHPFDPEYLQSEDCHLFERLERQGARFVYCREAWVSEYLPPQRTSLRYLVSRGFMGGHSHTRRKIDFAGSKHLPLRFLMVAKGMIFGTVSLFLSVIFIPDPFRRTHWMMKCASNLGRFLAAFGWKYQHYR